MENVEEHAEEQVGAAVRCNNTQSAVFKLNFKRFVAVCFCFVLFVSQTSLVGLQRQRQR